MQPLSLSSLTSILLLATKASMIDAFQPTTNVIRSNMKYQTQLEMKSNEDGDKTPISADMNRRSSLFNMFKTTTTAMAIMTTVGTTTLPTAVFAKSGSSSSTSYAQAEQDKQKIVKGYKRLDYLLNNWEKETTICKRNDNPYQGCDRTPEKVMEYLGYKSMDDPLFRADKTMIRLQALVPSSDKQGSTEFQDAIDTWMEKAEEGNGMAYISSWGEANPGGGRDRVALFIERSRKDVIEAKDSLGTIIRILDLKVD